MAHILLVEDDESLRKFLAQALVRAGHEVIDFGDGQSHTAPGSGDGLCDRPGRTG